MKNLKTLLLFLLLASLCIKCQTEKRFNFEIDGTINADTGKISLSFYEDYTSNKLTELVTHVKDKKFSFSGFITEPQGINILLEGRYISSYFVIDKGLQTIVINIDSTERVPDVKNQIMINDYPNYEAFFKAYTIKRKLFYIKSDSLQGIYQRNIPNEINLALRSEYNALNNEENKLLLRYCEKNPNSYLGLWRLVYVMNWGYEPIFDSIYNSFSDNIKNGPAGTTLKNKLQESKMLTVGKNFPLISCVDRNNKPFVLDLFKDNKYTLVDFWYSGCGPCRAQFGKLKDLYNQFNTKGFEIAAISVDKDIDKTKWENIIQTEKLIWKQYWDINGKETKNLPISGFPTNFLIDKDGKIVAKNISLEELDQLLNKNLGASKSIE